ncbi:AAA family ATPase [Pantoea ananatis]|nr:AAA family ATPase [Pantoea ananatis]
MRALAQALELNYARVQLMPSDVSGHAVHLLLADEINRAPAKTRSSRKAPTRCRKRNWTASC